jgi:hypothetical protein
VPFNEGWGQFDALAAYDFVKALDNTRTIDHASGWHDQGGGDLNSRHVYFKKIRLRPDSSPYVLSEFGGYSMKTAGHTFSEKEFGYKKFKTSETLAAAYKDLYEKYVIAHIDQGLSATVYTQVSDVEDEINGLFTYDRKVEKFPAEMLKQINERVKL